jgi:hypothetical protein
MAVLCAHHEWLYVEALVMFLQALSSAVTHLVSGDTPVVATPRPLVFPLPAAETVGCEVLAVRRKLLGFVVRV